MYTCTLVYLAWFMVSFASDGRQIYLAITLINHGHLDDTTRMSTFEGCCIQGLG